MSVAIALSNHNAQLAYSRMTSFVNACSSPVTTKSNTYEGVTDSIKLSAQSLYAFSREWIKGQLDRVTTRNNLGEYNTVDEITVDYAEKLAGFANNFRNLLNRENIPLNGNIPLQTDGIGHIICTDAENEECGLINTLLRSSIDITSDFMNVAACESIVSKVKDDQGFIGDYTENPAQTLQHNEASLRSYILQLQISVGRSGVSSELVDQLYY